MYIVNHQQAVGKVTQYNAHYLIYKVWITLNTYVYTYITLVNHQQAVGIIVHIQGKNNIEHLHVYIHIYMYITQ